jgi:dTDP-4-amino-4,6-dideoxygalactose transaminase
MIFTEFAPNEQKNDSFESLKMLFLPWQWKKGKYTSKFKNRLKKRFFPETHEIFLFLTGRCGLYHTLKSLDLPPKSEILVQGFTCESVILPILALKLKPVYIDISPEDFSMKSEDIEKNLTAESKVLILQHSFGMTPLKRDAILKIAREKKLIVIEDAAHGFNPELFKKKPAQSIILLSFGRSKPFSSVFGGAIITKNKKVIEHLAKTEKQLPYPSTYFLLKQLLYKILTPSIKSLYKLYIGRLIHGGLKSLQILMPEISLKEKRGEYDLMFSKAFPNMNAYLALQQLHRYNDVIKERTTLTEYYNIKLNKDYKGSLLRYPLLVKSPEKVIQKAARKKIFLGSWYRQAIAPKGIRLAQMLYESKLCPQAEDICAHIINLPTNVTRDQAKQIIELIDD